LFNKVGTASRDLEVMAEEEQQFLLRQQQYLQQSGGAPVVAGPASLPVGAAPGVAKSGKAGPGAQGSPKKVLLK
jgi:hypothetical protein